MVIDPIRSIYQGCIRACVFLALILSVGCMATKPSPVILERDDPLIGTIVESSSGRALTFNELIDRATAVDVVYLAEKHDNTEHHLQQVKIIEALVDRGLKPVLGFEFFDVGETGVLTQYALGKASTMKLKSSHKRSPEELLRRKLGWEHQDDQYWSYYFNLIDLAKKHRLDIFGSDLPSGIKTRISRGGLESLNGLERSQLKHSGFEDLAYQEMMYQEFRDGHCGWGEASLLRRLYQTWIARNDRMAASIVTMTDEKPKGPVVVILGNGHVRHDMGVYERVGHLRPALKQLNLGFREITVEPMPLAGYLGTETIAGKTFAPIHQLLWFTQRQDYEDPCARFFAPKK